MKILNQAPVVILVPIASQANTLPNFDTILVRINIKLVSCAVADPFAYFSLLYNIYKVASLSLCAVHDLRLTALTDYDVLFSTCIKLCFIKTEKSHETVFHNFKPQISLFLMRNRYLPFKSPLYKFGRAFKWYMRFFI